MAIIDTVADEESAVSWGAILAGAVCSLAVTLIIVTFGLGAGLSVISPWGGEGVTSVAGAKTAGLLLVAVAMLSSTVGGFVAGRLRPGWADIHEDERYFRDTAHGLTAWAVATLVSVALLGSVTTKIVSGAASGFTTVASTAASQAGDSGYIDRLLRPNTNAVTAPGTTQPQGNATGLDQATRNDITRIFTTALTSKDGLSQDDRAYLGSVIAQRTGLSQAEAEQRIDSAITQAKQAADTARKAGAKLSFWIAASLLAGALAAMLAATVGGWLRSSIWWDTAKPVTPAVAPIRKR